MVWRRNFLNIKLIEIANDPPHMLFYVSRKKKWSNVSLHTSFIYLQHTHTHTSLRNPWARERMRTPEHPAHSKCSQCANIPFSLWFPTAPHPLDFVLHSRFFPSGSEADCWGSDACSRWHSPGGEQPWVFLYWLPPRSSLCCFCVKRVRLLSVVTVGNDWKSS